MNITNMFIKISILKLLVQEINGIYRELQQDTSQQLPQNSVLNPVKTVLTKDVERMKWLADHPIEAINILGRVQPGELRFLRIAIDAKLVKRVIND